MKLLDKVMNTTMNIVSNYIGRDPNKALRTEFYCHYQHFFQQNFQNWIFPVSFLPLSGKTQIWIERASQQWFYKIWIKRRFEGFYFERQRKRRIERIIIGSVVYKTQRQSGVRGRRLRRDYVMSFVRINLKVIFSMFCRSTLKVIFSMSLSMKFEGHFSMSLSKVIFSVFRR